MQRLLLVLVLTATTVLTAHARPGKDEPQERRLPGGEHSVLVSSGSAAGLSAREIAGPDTFVLYGGPGEPAEGKFQMPDGVTPDWGGGNGLPGGYGGGPHAWTPVDYSFRRNHWHVDTYNAENLNWNGAGNHAMWCGLPASDPDAVGWASAPGYGNGWFDDLLYVSEPVADESAGQVVDLDFFFNYDAEETWDFVEVQFLRAGVWETVMAATGTNGVFGNFPEPGTPFDALQFAPIEYFGNDYAYGGLVSGGIAVKIRFWSDGAWSNEDGFWPGKGAAQVDDITITHSGGTFFEDFEGGGPYLWEPWQRPFFGDFADVYERFSDIDPCRENPTPVAGFIDYDQVVRNGPGSSGAVQTGGEPNQNSTYGIPGNWAVNHSGGLDPGAPYIKNAILSPEILLDLPGTDDDDPAFAGYTLRFDVWEDGGDPALGDGKILYHWQVRSAWAGGAWSNWTGDNYYLGFGADGEWVSRSFDLSPYVQPGAEKLQVRFVVNDLCEFSFGCDPNSTPAPVFDNVTVTKYRLPGPVISAHSLDLAQGGFPVSGTLDVSTVAGRDLLDRPFDTGRDFPLGDAYTPGDSVVVEVVPFVAGTNVSDVRMFWALSTTSVFEDAIRAAPSRPVDEDVVAGPTGTVWSGAVVGQISERGSGTPVPNLYCVDLPDEDFAYPGDVLHYYIQATDSDGRVSTLPYDLTGFGDFSPMSAWPTDFTVRALPTILDPAGAQPSMLVIDDGRREGESAGYRSALGQLGYLEGVDYDVYRALSGSNRENTIGSPGKHGATAAQVAGYEHVLYLQETSTTGLSVTGSGYSLEADDVGLLTDWWALGGSRNLALFGDDATAWLQNNGIEGQAFLTGMMGVDFVGDDVAPSIGGQVTPGVVANPDFSQHLTTPFAAYGGCPRIADFDHIRPAGLASAGHYFADPGGTAITDPSAGVASVVRSGGPGYVVTVPFALFSVQGAASRAVGPAARTALLGEILDLFGSTGGSPPVGAPSARVVSLRVTPNPFNPRTVVQFTGVLGREGAVQVFNLRGELVRELHRGEFTGGEFVWDGTDDAGAVVASGVYVVRAEAGDATRTAKVALVR